MTVKKHSNGYFGIFVGDRCIATFASFEKACAFLAPEPAKFEGHDAEGLAIYSGVSL